jgi:hypothetical protein
MSFKIAKDQLANEILIAQVKSSKLYFVSVYKTCEHKPWLAFSTDNMDYKNK